MILFRPCFSEWLIPIILTVLSVKYSVKIQNNLKKILYIPDILKIILTVYTFLSLLLIVEAFIQPYKFLILTTIPILSLILIVLILKIHVSGVRLYVDKFFLFPLHIIAIILAVIITTGFLIVEKYLVGGMYFASSIFIYILFYLFNGNTLWSNVLIPLIILTYNLPWIAFMETIQILNTSLTVSLGLIIISIAPLCSIIKHVKNSTTPLEENTNPRVILLYYPSALSLLKAEKRKKFYEVMDRFLTRNIEELILITKPFGLVSKLILNYLFLTLSVEFEESKLRSIYELVVTPSKIVSIPDRFSRKRKLLGEEELVIESRIVGAEPFLITSVIKDRVEGGKSKLIIIDDIADLVYTMGVEKTYKLVRELALAVSLVNEVKSGNVKLLLFLPSNVLGKAEEKLFINIVDEAIII